MNLQRSIVLAVAAACACGAHAQTMRSLKTPDYVGLSLAITDSEFSTADAARDTPNPAAFIGRQFEQETRATGFRISAGHRWGPIWSTELAYTDYGQTKARTTDGVSPEYHLWVGTRGYSVASVWRMETERNLNLVTRLGLSFNQTRIVLRSADVSGSAEDKRGTWAPLYGLGLEYDFGDGWRGELLGDATMVKVLDQRFTVKYYGLGASKSF